MAFPASLFLNLPFQHEKSCVAPTANLLHNRTYCHLAIPSYHAD